MSGTSRIIASGSELMVFIKTGTELAPIIRPIANQTGAVLTIEPADRKVVSKNAGRWGKTAAGLMNWKVSVDADLSDPLDTNADEVDFMELQTAVLSRDNVNIIVAFIAELDGAAEIDATRPQWAGAAKVNFPINAKHGESMSTGYEFEGQDELTPTLPGA